MNNRIGIALLLLLTACGTSRDGSTTPLVITPHLALDLPLGSTDSVLVGSLRDATRISDGRLALLDADRNRLVFADSTGKLLGTSGRAGEGPGEFVIPSWIGRCTDDSLYVLDRGPELISVFDSVGRFARSFHPPFEIGQVIACGSKGRFAILDPTGIPQMPANLSAEPTLYTGAVVAFNSTGKILQRIPNLPLAQFGMLRSLAAVGIVDTELIVGISSSAVLHRYGPDGTVVRVDSFPLVKRPVTDSLYAADIDRMVNRMGGNEIQRTGLRKMLATIPKPADAPLYQLLLVAPDGIEWLVISLPTDPVTDVMGRLPDGRFVQLTFPRLVDVYEIGPDYLLGKALGPDGESHLMMYRWVLPPS